MIAREIQISTNAGGNVRADDSNSLKCRREKKNEENLFFETVLDVSVFLCRCGA